ncbi:MAG TPA: TM2 domain-containing protein, partial [Flavobacteriales bacterium]|nr:TM2 domain-containing protein [Flavobacteriales bacterium]
AMLSRPYPTTVLLCAILLCAVPQRLWCAGPYQNAEHELAALLPQELASADQVREPKRLVAAALTLTLGTFAAHRLYLGTDVKVPILYGLTFGGFGILVLIDLGHILFTKDLQAYCRNNKVLMWAGGPRQAATPP